MSREFIRPDVSYAILGAQGEVDASIQIRLYWNFGRRAATLLVDKAVSSFLQRYVGGTEPIRWESWNGHESVITLKDFLDRRQLLVDWQAPRFGRWSRQLPVWMGMQPKTSPEATQARLANSRVAVLGLGGIGSNVALQLAYAGVRNFTLLDPDKVEDSNLNRQLSYEPSDIGRLKTEALNDRLSRIGGRNNNQLFVESITDSSLRSVGETNPDIIVLAADEPSLYENLMATVAVLPGSVVLIGGGYFGLNCFAGPLLTPLRRPCDRCLNIFFSPAGIGARHKNVGGSVVSIAMMAASISTTSCILHLTRLADAENPLDNTVAEVTTTSPNTTYSSIPRGACCTSDERGAGHHLGQEVRGSSVPLGLKM